MRSAISTFVRYHCISSRLRYSRVFLLRDGPCVGLWQTSTIGVSKNWIILWGQTDMKVGGWVHSGWEDACWTASRYREQRDRSHNSTALPRATFLLVIPEAFMLVSLVSQRRP